MSGFTDADRLLLNASDEESEEYSEETPEFLKMLEEMALKDKRTKGGGPNEDIFREIDETLEKSACLTLNPVNESLTNQEETERLKYRPPGLQLIDEKPFHLFSFKNLDLVEDFGYEVKGKARGFESDRELLAILRDPFKFIMFLSPEATSSLITDEKDFCAICDFTYYSLVSYCQVYGELRHHFEIFQKALFDLLRNYGFDSWKLTLAHLILPLINLGFKERVLTCGSPKVVLTLPEFYKGEHQDNLTPDRDRLRSFCDEYYEFPADKMFDYDQGLLTIRQEQLQNVVKLIADLTVSFSNETYLSNLRPKRSYANTLVFLRVLITIATEEDVVFNSEIKHDVMRIVYEVLDWFPEDQWVKSAHFDVTKMMVNSGTIQEHLRTWKVEDVPSCTSRLDHHHNLVERLRLLPPSLRGIDIKRSVAFCWLKHIIEAENGDVQNPQSKDIVEVALLFKENEYKIKKNIEPDTYAMLSVLRLCDAVFGPEPVISHMGNFKEARKYLTSYLERYVSQLRRNNESYSRSKELFTQIKMKWEMFENADKPALRQPSIERYVTKY